jgi:hypothetical protein
MNAGRIHPTPDSRSGLHIATIAHEGLIWDTYLDFENDLHRPTIYRASLRFEPPTGDGGAEPTRTTAIIVEDSYEEAVAKARSFDDRQLQGLLRSTLPDPEQEQV